MLILLAVVSFPGRGACVEGRINLAPWRVERDTLRLESVVTGDFLRVMSIRPGMTILDIGAGTGQFAYAFASAMHGSGAVYATDTNESCVEFMKGEAARRGLSNIHPVLVRKEGVDPFYGKHAYDLMTVFHLSSMACEEQSGYFRTLRGFLAAGGRLVLLLYKIPVPFSAGDFDEDLEGLIRELSLEPAESPFHTLLRDSTRKLIAARSGPDVPAALRDAIVSDFNAMLSDSRLPARFHAGSTARRDAAFTPEERRYANWLLAPFRDDAALKRNPPLQAPSAAGTLPAINKLLIIQRYRRHLKREGLFAPGFTHSVRAAFEKAGYGVERVYPDLVPFEDLVVLTGAP
jgi:SAM-dependent methyltransferase